MAQSPYEGKLCFQIKDSKPDEPRAVSIPGGTGPNTNRPNGGNQMVVKGEVTMKDFY